MNEGENTGMPTTPDFSSPNTSPNPQPAQPAEQPAAPAEPSVSDEQPAAPTEQSASVYAAAASLPAEDLTKPSQTISSGNNKPAGISNRFGFARKFKKQEPQQPVQPAFSNAPEYFNNAVQDIAIADAAADDAKRKRKKIALIAVAVLLVIGAGLGAFFLIQQANKPSANRVKTAFNRYANYVLYGEEKDSDIGEYSDTARYTIMDKYLNRDDNYNKRLNELFEAFTKEYASAAENGLYEKDGIDYYKDIYYAVYDSYELDNQLSFERIISLYESEGSEAAEEAIEDVYEQYGKNTDHRYVYDWYATRTDYINVLDAFSTYGCLLSGAFDGQCLSNAANDPTVRQAKDQNATLQEKELESMADAKVQLYEQLWSVI